MLKKLIFIFTLLFFLVGCTGSQPEDVNDTTDVSVVSETSPENESCSGDYCSIIGTLKDPLQVVLDNHNFMVGDTLTTTIEMTRESYREPNFNVTITESGYKDDSVKGSEFKMILEIQEDRTWKMIEKEQTNIDCYRGTNDKGWCL